MKDIDRSQDERNNFEFTINTGFYIPAIHTKVMTSRELMTWGGTATSIVSYVHTLGTDLAAEYQQGTVGLRV